MVELVETTVASTVMTATVLAATVMTLALGACTVSGSPTADPAAATLSASPPTTSADTGDPSPADKARPGTAPTIAAITGLWQGTYTCAQGPTTLRLKVAGDGATQFDFKPERGGDSSNSGAFAMTATAVDGQIRFTAGPWVWQPPGYETVDLLTTSVTNGTMSGRVLDRSNGCTTFSVTRQ